LRAQSAIRGAVQTITKTVTVAAGVFAAGHLGELTWQVPFELVDAVLEDTLATERRHPRMPGEDAWAPAVQRLPALLGRLVSPLRSAANVAELARQAREAARARAGDCRVLANLLTRHAAQLGLDARGETGRLATANRAATLLDQLTRETDDVVLVELLASADLGDVDDMTASRSVSTAREVASALARTQWSVLDAVAQLTDDRVTDNRAEQARILLEQLAEAAVREQMHRDLIAELDKAVQLGVQLLTANRPPVPPVEPQPPTQQLLPASQQLLPTSPLPLAAPPAAAGAGGERVVRDQAELRQAEAEIAELLERNPGRAVRVTWTVQG
jgi:hypothetical protein